MKKQYVLVHAEDFKCYDNILLVMKDRPEWQKGFFNLVGGKVEEGESSLDAALRELKEETGYTLHPRIPSTVIQRVGAIETDEEYIHCYKIPIDSYNQDAPKPRDGETEIVRWYPWNLVVNDCRLIPSLRLVIPLMLSGIRDWNLYVKDSFMNKDINTVQVTIPSHLSYIYTEKSGATKILQTGNIK